MVKSCLVATCKNTQGVPGITFHKIGKKRYTDRLKAIGRSPEDNLSPQNVICSKHFAEGDFIHFNGKKYLRIEALPRLFVPRRPKIDQTVQTINEPPDKINNTSALNMLDVQLENDTWLMYANNTDLLILNSPQHDDIDIDIDETNLSMYPTNDFLTSLISDCCDNDNFDFELDLPPTDVFET